MEDLYELFSDDYEDHIRYQFCSESKQLKVSEVCSFQGHVQSPTKAVSDIVNFAADRCSKCPVSEQVAATSLCAVWLPYTFDFASFEVRKDDFDLLLEAWDLRSAIRYGLVRFGSWNFIRLPPGETSLPIVCVASLHDFGVCWSYNQVEKRSNAIFWGPDQVLVRMQSILKCLKSNAQNPEFPMVILVTCIEMNTRHHLRRIMDDVILVENRTKHHNLNRYWPAEAKGSFSDLFAKMSGCETLLAQTDFRLFGAQSMLTTLDEFRIRRGAATSYEIDQCVASLATMLANHRYRTSYIVRRAVIQNNAITNLIPSKESRISIAVAKDSHEVASTAKEDSTSMKTIAVVTITFLPGTFVAALFAVPMFEWNAASDESIISTRFWVYWAVTIPLTLFTIGSWFLWTKQMNLYRREELSKVKQRFMNDIKDLGGNPGGDDLEGGHF